MVEYTEFNSRDEISGFKILLLADQLVGNIPILLRNTKDRFS